MRTALLTRRRRRKRGDECIKWRGWDIGRVNTASGNRWHQDREGSADLVYARMRFLLHLGKIHLGELAVGADQLSANVNALQILGIAGEDQRGIGIIHRRAVDRRGIDDEEVAELADLE